MYSTAHTFVLFEPRRAKRRSPKARAAAQLCELACKLGVVALLGMVAYGVGKVVF